VELASRRMGMNSSWILRTSSKLEEEPRSKKLTLAPRKELLRRSKKHIPPDRGKNQADFLDFDTDMLRGG
jgi:hypothetical protein